MQKDLHLRRKKDGIEVITLEKVDHPPIAGRKHEAWNANVKRFVPVRYVKSGRKGYIKLVDLEADFVVVGRADPDKRWAPKQAATVGESAAAMEIMRERDIAAVKKRILEQIEAPAPHRHKKLADLNPTPNALVALEQAVHMILAGT